MEKKKLLLVVISVGVFLVIVVGATMLVFAPGSDDQTVIASAAPMGSVPAGDIIVSDAAAGESAGTAVPEGPATVDASEWVRNPQAVAGLQPPPQSASSNRGDVIIIYGERPNQGAVAGSVPNAGDAGLVIDVPPPQTSSVPRSDTPRQMTPSTATAANENAVSVKKAVQPAAKAPSVKQAPAKPIEKKVPPKSAAAIRDDYWVQTGSFSAKARAEAAKETLSTKGIASLVETKEVGGKTFFRVRVGPYTSKTEAEYWLSLVKTIDGFGESYVSLTKTKR